MLEHSDIVESEDAVPADPYGDVALGVECAWPETVPGILFPDTVPA